MRGGNHREDDFQQLGVATHCHFVAEGNIDQARYFLVCPFVDLVFRLGVVGSFLEWIFASGFGGFLLGFTQSSDQGIAGEAGAIPF